MKQTDNNQGANMKFSFSFQKLNKDKIKTAENHNHRSHPTESQLPKTEWFTRTQNMESLAVEWNHSAMDKAKSLQGRKDAVLAIEFVIQVGNQRDWREEPTHENSFGKALPLTDDFVERFFAQSKKWVSDEFGIDNLVSMQLHIDESTPHMHVVVTPITKKNKLQAKEWLDGGSRIGSIRQRCHKVINEKIECTYTPNSGVGGAPHDTSKRAGSAPVPTFAEKLTGKKKIADLTDENTLLKARVKRLEDLHRYREVARFNKTKIENADIAIHQSALLSHDVAYLTKSLETLENDFKKKEFALMSQHNTKITNIENVYDDKIRSLKTDVSSLRNQLENANSDIVVLTKKNNHLADQNNELDAQVRNRHGYE